MELVGARWTGAIIQILLTGRARFGELRVAVPDMSDRMLSERLRELETEGIVERTVIPDVPVRIEYALTDKGRALKRALDEIGAWAERWVSADDLAAPQRPERRRGTPTAPAPRAGHHAAARRPSRRKGIV